MKFDTYFEEKKYEDSEFDSVIRMSALVTYLLKLVFVSLTIV